MPTRRAPQRLAPRTPRAPRPAPRSGPDRAQRTNQRRRPRTIGRCQQSPSRSPPPPPRRRPHGRHPRHCLRPPKRRGRRRLPPPRSACQSPQSPRLRCGLQSNRRHGPRSQFEKAMQVGPPARLRWLPAQLGPRPGRPQRRARRHRRRRSRAAPSAPSAGPRTSPVGSTASIAARSSRPRRQPPHRHRRRAVETSLWQPCWLGRSWSSSLGLRSLRSRAVRRRRPCRPALSRALRSSSRPRARRSARRSARQSARRPGPARPPCLSPTDQSPSLEPRTSSWFGQRAARRPS